MSKGLTDQEREEFARDAEEMWRGDAPVPDWMELTPEEQANLDAMRKRMGLESDDSKEQAA